MIFVPSRVHHSYTGNTKVLSLPEDFSVFSWNVHKQNIDSEKFLSFSNGMIEDYQLSFVLLQEAEINPDKCAIKTFSYDAAVNLDTGRKLFGVLSASIIDSMGSKAFLSRRSEGFVGTRKSMLVSTYPMNNGRKLMVVNVHAINFREHKAYRGEIDLLIDRVSGHEGPMIIAGDFNTWNQKRVDTVTALEERLSLSRVNFGASMVKEFRGYPLDMIFYRGLTNTRSTVIADHGISDHHPLIASFRAIV